MVQFDFLSTYCIHVFPEKDDANGHSKIENMINITIYA